MQIGLFQLNARIGDIEGNVERMERVIANNRDCELLVFPELMVQGYMPYDFLSFYDARQIHSIVDRISKCVTPSQRVIVGLALPLDEYISDYGKNIPSFIKSHPHNTQSTAILENCACLISSNGLDAVQSKQELPNYNVFFESRYFATHVNATQCIDLSLDSDTLRLGLLICEDAWIDAGVKHGKKTPLLQLKDDCPDLVICLSASPFEHYKILKRVQIAQNVVQHLGCAMLFVNLCGGNDEIIFDGSSFVLDEKGNIINMLPFAEEAESKIHYDSNTRSLSPISCSPSVDETSIKFIEEYALASTLGLRLGDLELERMSKIIQLGLKDYIEKSGLARKVHLGLSGGIDSALTALLAVRVLGAEHVTGILLPSKFTSSQSIEDAKDLAARLKIPTETLSIVNTHSEITQELQELYKESNNRDSLTDENVQARIRGLMLMAYSNTYGSVLLTTGNKSEIAVGYCTLYGDMCGSLNLIGDLYKTEVYALARYLNRDFEYIPQNIIDKEPSAELRADQKDSDSLPPYSILDKILFHYIEGYLSPDELIAQKVSDEETIRRVWNLYVHAEYKRYQAAPIIKLSTHAFGKGRIVPLVHKFDAY